MTWALEHLQSPDLAPMGSERTGLRLPSAGCFRTRFSHLCSGGSKGGAACVRVCVWSDLMQTRGAESWGSLLGRPVPGRYPHILSSEDVGMEGCVYLDASVLHDNQPPGLVCEWQPPTPAAPTRFCCRGQGGGLCFVRSHPGPAQGLSLCVQGAGGID